MSDYTFNATATEDNYQDTAPDLDHAAFYTDRAKDQAYMKAQEVVKAAKAKGLEISGTEFIEHGKRRDILGENLTNYTPAKFALNHSA